MSEPDYDAVLMGWRAPTTSAGAAAVRPPTLTELGQAKMVGHVCRVVAGKGTAAAAAAAAAVGAAAAHCVATSVAAAKKTKLGSVISQIGKTEVLLADGKEVLKAYMHGSNRSMVRESVLPRSLNLLQSKLKPSNIYWTRASALMQISRSSDLRRAHPQEGETLRCCHWTGWVAEAPRVSRSVERGALALLQHGFAKRPSDVGRCGFRKSAEIQDHD